MFLGIDQKTDMVFEGNSYYGGHLVWPSPMLSPAKFISASDNPVLPARYETYTNYLFREDTFDPVTRVRRGRFYKSNQTQPERWTVMISPPMSATQPFDDMRAWTYFSCPISEMPTLVDANQHLVILGTTAAFSLWTIINRELIYTNEIVFTLKARQSFGVLPEIDWGMIPDKEMPNISEALQTLEDDYHIASPESVVDRANEAATRVLNAYLQTIGKKLHDSLSKITTTMSSLDSEDKREVAKNAADIVRLLHGRTKYAVQKVHNARPIREQDAELSIQCIGLMLCDLGWARWL